VRHRVDGLAQQQEGDRPDDNGPSGNTLSERFFQLSEDLGRVQRELGRGLDLGNDVVVIGVEPLGHLQRRDVLVAARGGEVASRSSETDMARAGSAPSMTVVSSIWS